MAQVRKAAVTLKGGPVNLIGPELKVGDTAPNFTAQAADLSEVTLASTGNKMRVFASIPSLDTPVCSTETKKFNEQVAKIANLDVFTVSMDLPFGQKRWCGSEGVENVKCLSDHGDASFGQAYGVLIESGPLRRVLARAVFVVGPDNKLRHVEYVPEIATEPNYEAILAAVKAG